MSSAPGRVRVPKRCSRASTVPRTSSRDKVVWLITATGLPPESSRAASCGDSTTTVESGRSPRVPITSTWFACPTSATRWPLSAYRRASACTFETRGQTASTTRSPRRSQFRRTAGATPCADSTQISPGGISSSDCTKTAPILSSRRTTWSLWTISWRTYTGAPCCSSRRSTISIARSTPAQNERGAASSTLPLTAHTPATRLHSNLVASFGRSRGHRPLQRAQRGHGIAHGAQRVAATRHHPAQQADDVRAAVYVHGLIDALDRALDAVGDDTDHAREPAAAGEHAALHVDRVRAARRVQPAALRRVVHELVGSEHRRSARARDAERRALPERGARLVDDARRVEHVADAIALVQRAGEAERDERRLGDAVRRAHSDAHRAQAGTLRDALLGGRRTGERQRRQPVSVHAMLRTVSFRLFDDSNAADGSKPECMPQCSQRGSLPGPYDSQSIPSSSASYVGKIPSVS